MNQASNDIRLTRELRPYSIFCLLLVSLGILLTLSACAPDSSESSQTTNNDVALGVSGRDIVQADNSGWLSHGRTYSEQRHSPLSKINDQTVSRLGLQWSFDLGSSRGIEATPIVHDGIIYVTSTWNVVHALNAVSGEKIWSFNPDVDKAQAGKGCCDVVNRGVAIWGDSIFTATIDGRLISLDAKTGKLNWDINTIDKSKPYTITGAPRIIDGRVIIGNGGAELGVRGYVTAYSAETGDQLWRFYTVPGDPANGFESDTMSMAAKTWTGEYWAAGGGGTAWDSMAYDAELDLLYIGVGNGSPWNHGIRSPDGGDNLFLSSIVALKPSTGEYVWHYQTTPAESWDYTATQHMILAELKIEGERRKVIMQAPKNGFFYVLDRKTGEFISANNFVTVTWATHIDKATGRPVESKFARYYQGDKPNIQLPGPLGAHNWHPMSYSPDTGYVYIPAQEAPWVYDADSNYEYAQGVWNTGTDFTLGMLPSQKSVLAALKASVKGRLIAWDPVKQTPAWTFEHGGPWNGGVLSTSGNLVFQGTADAHFAAYNATTGERLWRFFTQTGIVAAPITYEIDGEQYLAVASGWGGSYALIAGGVLPTGSSAKVGRLMVFKLDASNGLPKLPEENFVPPVLPAPLDVSEANMAIGLKAYANRCAMCHGDQAYSSGLIPNLRYSPITKSKQAWQQVVREGALENKGMPNFGSVLDQQTVEAIRAYVISEANSDRDAEFYRSLR